MIVEVVAVGTELLLGDIVNTNAAFIGRRLATDGFDIHHQVVVGDNLGRLVETLRGAVSRADAVVITGGIGPTKDDLTREAICELAGVGMTRDEQHAAWIEERIRARGRTPESTVFRMADLPEGSEPLANANGVALGLAMEHDGRWLFAVPGVPTEMASMFDREVLPRLRQIAGKPAVLRSRVLHCWGLGESAIGEKLDDLFASVNPSVAFLINDMEVNVRITAKTGDEAEALRLISPMEDEIRERLGSVVFGSDADTVEGLVIAGLMSHGWSVATIEDATLGQVGARLRHAGGGEVFAGSVIPGLAEQGPPRADVVLDVGVVGPDRTEGARTTRAVEMTITTPGGVTQRTFDFGGDDERLRAFATIAALHLLRIAVEPDY